MKYLEVRPCNSTQLNSTQLNSTQLNSTQLNSTQLNSTQLNSTQLNSTQLNSTQLNRIVLFITIISLAFLASCSRLTDSTSSLSNFDDIPLLSYYTRNSVNLEPVTVRVLGKTSDMDIAHTFEAGYGTTFPILGLYPDYLNTVEITDGGQTIVRYIQTEPLPSDIVNATVFVDNLPAADPFNQDLYWISRVAGTFTTVAYDRIGDIRYLGGGELCRVFESGEKIHIIYPYSHNERTLDGDIIFEANSITAYHHDIIILNSGNYVLLANSTWGVEDRVIEQTSSGLIVRDLTFGSLFRDIVDVETNPNRVSDMDILNQIIYDDNNIRQIDGVNAGTDWAHANSLVYDEDSDIMYFSLRAQAVIAVKYSSWELLWWMVDDSLYSMSQVADGSINFTDVSYLQAYRVQGEGATDGPKNQHALFLFENGNLGMFDNQGDEDTNPAGSRYVEYQITGSIGSWLGIKAREYRDPNLYSRIRSDVDITGEGNLLILWATTSRVREIDLDSQEILFDIQASKGEYQYRSYRADKMPIYPYQDPNKKYAMDYNEKEGK